MNRHTRRDGSSQDVARLATVLSVAMLFAACDGANQGVQIGTGQNPDPVVVDFPIAYVKSPVPTDDNGNFEQSDLREQITFDVGGNLFFKDRASTSAVAVNITERVISDQGAVRDVEMSFDGESVLFAMRGPVDPNLALDDPGQPTWNIWEYEFATDQLRRIITSDLIAETGHDIMPKYLPDGRIVFSSTRQVRSRAVLLDESKAGFSGVDEDDNEFAFNLHIMNADGSNLDQLSFNQSHDLDPSVLDDGSIVYSRWDNAPGNNQVNLYRMNPDGSSNELLYGNESHETGPNGTTIQFMQPRQAEDGRVFSVIRPFTNTEGGGEIVAIDTPQYVEQTQPLAPNIGILTGPAQEDITFNNVVTAPGQPSPGGRYFSAYPIQDGTGRMLVSWSQCRLIEANVDLDPTTPDIEPSIVPCTAERLANLFVVDPNNVQPPPDGTFLVAPPLYGIWIYDPRDQTQLPVVPGEEGFMFTEVVSADPRPTPPVIIDGSNDFAFDPAIGLDGEAVLNIRSVYDFDGTAVVNITAMADPGQTTADQRPARFLRIVKAVTQPDDDLRDIDDTAFGVSTATGMREIVGYAMVEPDGSVMTKVPANTALMVSVLDADGKRITPRHNNWISLRPGQVLECNGCHVANNGLSHGRRGAFDPAYAGAPTAGVQFPNTDPQWFVGNVGDTMAETRAAITCAVNNCSSIEPSMNVVFRDVWTDSNVRAPDPDIDYLYADLQTQAPVLAICLQGWASNCRAEIHYEMHIHPLWSLPRPQFDAAGNPILDAQGNQVDRMCTNCHTQIDPADGMTVIVPAGQLELTDGPSADEPDHFHAYRELLVTDNLQEVVNGALVDATQVVGIDANGNPILDVIPIAPPASIAGATASSDFFDRFDDPNNVEHFNVLSGAEKRLIAEWLDIGAQYYNDPFDAPEN